MMNNETGFASQFSWLIMYTWAMALCSNPITFVPSYTPKEHNTPPMWFEEHRLTNTISMDLKYSMKGGNYVAKLMNTHHQWRWTNVTIFVESKLQHHWCPTLHSQPQRILWKLTTNGVRRTPSLWSLCDLEIKSDALEARINMSQFEFKLVTPAGFSKPFVFLCHQQMEFDECHLCVI